MDHNIYCEMKVNECSRVVADDQQPWIEGLGPLKVSAFSLRDHW